MEIVEYLVLKNICWKVKINYGVAILNIWHISSQKLSYMYSSVKINRCSFIL